MPVTEPASILKKIGRGVRFLCVVVKTFFAFTLFCSLLVLLYLVTIGFPPWLVKRVSSELDSSTVAFHARVIRLIPPCGVVLKDVRLYARHKLGPPILEARRLDLCFSPASLLKGDVSVSDVTITDGVLRPEMLGEAGLPAAPRPVSAPVQLRGHINNCRYLGIMIESLEGDFEAAGIALNVRNARGAVRNNAMKGTFTGDVDINRGSGKVTGHLVTWCDPHVLIPLMQAMGLTLAEELTRRFEFGSAVPKTELWFEQAGGETGQLRVGGTFRVADSSYVGVPVRMADGGLDMTFSHTGTVVRVHPLRIIRSEGTAEGGFAVTVDDRHGQVEFDTVSSLHPEAVLRIVGLVDAGDGLPFQFKAPFTMAAHGVVDFRGLTNTLFTSRMFCGGIGNGNVMIRDCSFDMLMEGRTNRCANVNGSLYGGTLAGSVEVICPRGAATDLVYHAVGTLTRADFKRFANELSHSTGHDYRGTLSGSFDIQGFGNDPALRRLKGTGDIKIKEGRVFMLPIFGGLSRHLAAVIPGLNFVIGQTDAKASFTLADGKAKTEKIVVEGDILSLSGQGTYAFDGDLDFEAQIRLLKEHTLVAKILRAPTYLISKLFEFRLRGSVADPRWYPVNFSSDLLEKIGLKNGEKPRDAAVDSSKAGGR